MELRDYQIRSIEKIREAFKQGKKRVILRLDCGSGKTLTSSSLCIKTATKDNEVLFLVHRQELLQQTIDTFEELGANMENINIGMVITVGHHLEKYNPKLIIADECNFAIAKTWKKVFDAYPNAYVIGLSATPIRLDGKGMGDVFDAIVSDITAKELIKRGNLSNYEYYAPPSKIDTSKIKIRGGDYAAEQLEEQLDKQTIYGDIINTFKTLADKKRTIIYCVTVNHSKKTCHEFSNAGYKCEHIDGTTPTKERKAIIERFRSGETQILTNCNLVSFGFDVPDCDCVVMLRPTQSLAIYIQSAMRCMRGKADKTAIIIDHVGNVFRHGFPDDDREWSLTGSKRKPKEANTVFVKQCPNCYFTYAKAMICPNCGHEVKKMAYEIKHDREVELERITEVRKNHLAERMEVIGGIENCRTLSECMAWCKVHGYKSGYAWHYWENKRKGVRFK